MFIKLKQNIMINDLEQKILKPNVGKSYQNQKSIAKWKKVVDLTFFQTLNAYKKYSEVGII